MEFKDLLFVPSEICMKCERVLLKSFYARLIDFLKVALEMYNFLLNAYDTAWIVPPILKFSFF